MPYKKHSIIRKRKHSGGQDDDEESVNPMNLSTIEGDEEFTMDDSDFDQDLNLSDLNTSTSGETTVEDMSQVVPDFSQDSEMNATPESLHLSDLDNETNNTTTESEIEGGKRKTAKRKGKGKKTKKTMKKRKSKKTSTKKRGGGKRATKKTLKQRKRKHYGGQDDLETSLMLSEKQILPKDENPAF